MWMNSLAGFLVGALVGMTGVGGGALMTPVLVLLFGISPAVAVGTDLWFAALTKSVGGFMHQRRGSVDWEVFRRLSLGSLPTSALTLAWLHISGAGQMQQGMILNALGFVLLLTAIAIVCRKRIQTWGFAIRAHATIDIKRMQPALTVVAGSVLGFLVTLTSVGGGALGVVILLFLYPFRMNPARLVGTDIVHAIPLTLVAGAGHLWMGNVDVPLLGWLLLGSIPGVAIGAYFNPLVPEKLLRVTIAVVLALVGLKLML